MKSFSNLLYVYKHNITTLVFTLILSLPCICEDVYFGILFGRAARCIVQVSDDSFSEDTGFDLFPVYI